MVSENKVRIHWTIIKVFQGMSRRWSTGSISSLSSHWYQSVHFRKISLTVCLFQWPRQPVCLFFFSLSFLFVLYSFCFVQSASLDKCKHQAIPLLSALAAVLYWVDVWTRPIYCCTQRPTVLLSISDARSTPDPRWYQEPSSMCLFTSWFCCLFFGREIWIRLRSGQVHTFYDFCCIEFFSFCPNLLIVS